jgi:hypothetical protein
MASDLIAAAAAPSTQVLRLDREPWIKWMNYGVKVALVVSFVIAIGLSPSTVEGKAMGFRAPLFLAPALIVPVLSRWRAQRRPIGPIDALPYPHTGDALLSIPFLLDTLGNLLGFYDSFNSTDDVLHALNWVFLVAAFHAFRFRTRRDNRDSLFLGYGFGAIAIIWWEVMEWAVSEEGFGGAGNLALTYGDTVGDLVLSSTGGLIGSWLGVRLLGAVSNRE